MIDNEKLIFISFRLVEDRKIDQIMNTDEIKLKFYTEKVDEIMHNQLKTWWSLLEHQQ